MDVQRRQHRGHTERRREGAEIDAVDIDAAEAERRHGLAGRYVDGDRYDLLNEPNGVLTLTVPAMTNAESAAPGTMPATGLLVAG